MIKINKPEKKNLLSILNKRFLKHLHRHQSLVWEDVLTLLSEDNVNSLYLMEKTGGEPDLITLDSGLYYVDMAKETPKYRRSVCYDEEARINRKKFPPKTSALEMALEMNIKLLDEKLYKGVQEIENFDLKTSSWISTPSELRKLGGALFADYRYGRTFIYHNGADSYYGVRGFRGYIKLK